MITIINSEGLGVEIGGSSLIAPAIIYLCIALAFYVLRSIGLFCLAKRAGLNKRILSFVPFLWVYIACKLIGNVQIFGRTFEKLAVLFCVFFSIAGYLQFIYDFLIYFPIAGNLLCGRPIFIIPEGSFEVDLDQYMPTLANGIYGLASGQADMIFVNPYKEAIVTIYHVLRVVSYFLTVLEIASIVISVSVYFNLFRKYWPQHYMLFGILSIFGLSAPFIFAIRNKEPIDFNEYLRSRYGNYGAPYGHYGNPYNNYGGPYGNGGYNSPPRQEPPKNPFEEFAGRGEKDPGNPFEEFDKKD